MSKINLRFVVGLLVVCLLLSLTGCSSIASQSAESKTTSEQPVVYQHPVITDPVKAQQLLVEGNQRYVSGSVLKQDVSNQKRGDLVTKGQKPFAVVLTCSDSRVPAELIFDQGLGDIFVIRVAGNVIDPVALGSIEYGIEHLGAPLVVVMGHDSCGAVKATIEGGESPGSIGAIVDEIKPSVDKAKKAGVPEDQLAARSEDENIAASVAVIEKSPIVEHLLENGKVKVVSAKYKLSTGEVTFFPAK